MSIVTTPDPSHVSHRPPAALKLKLPFVRPASRAAGLRAQSARTSSHAFV